MKDTSLPSSIETSSPAQILWFQGANGERLGARFWQGLDQRPLLIYLHGIEGHSLWFARTALSLQKQGINIIAVDRRGSGINPNERGHISGYQVWLKDLELVAGKIRSDFPDRPVFLMANCWGAKLATVAIAKAIVPSRHLRGLILTCPAIFTFPDVDLFTKLKIAWYSLKKHPHADRPMPIPLTASMFTDNPVYLDYIEKDPLRLTEATPRFFWENFLIGLKAQKAAPALNLPLLVMQSGKDKIVNAAALRRWFDAVAAPDKTFQLYDEVGHSLDFDAHQYDHYLACLLSWIEERAMVVSA